MKTALVCGAGGFIGGHLVRRLKKEGYWVRGVDLKPHEFFENIADDFVIGDLREQSVCQSVLDRDFDEVYQLAADMGGAGYIFTGDHDADIMHNSATINLNIAYYGNKVGIKKIFYSSSACMYPAYNQLDPDNPRCSEDSAYPAAPDSEYGWEKLFSERLYLSFARNYGMNVRIARFHNIFGPYGTWRGGKEKAPAAMCRKVAEADNGGEIEIWGDGKQTRSFLYIDECLEAVRRLMDGDFVGPVNIGSDEMVTINQLAEMAMQIGNKKLGIKHIDGPLGVRGRNSDNRLIEEKLKWRPTAPLVDGMRKTYEWISEQVELNQITLERHSKNPLVVSTITPCFRMKPYLKKFLDELPLQTYFNHLEVVLDHNEPDEEELRWVRDFQKKYPGKIKHIIVNPVEPIGTSMNRCIKEAKGELVTIWNVDDLRTPTSIESQVDALLREGGDIAIGDYKVVRRFGEKEEGYMVHHKHVPESEFKRGMYFGPFLMWKKSLCKKAGYFDEQLVSGADYDMSIRLAYNGKVVHAKDDLGYYLNEGKGASTRPNSKQPLERTVIELRYGVFDKLDMSYIPLIVNYSIPDIVSFGEKHPVKSFVKNYDQILADNKDRVNKSLVTSTLSSLTGYQTIKIHIKRIVKRVLYKTA
jgi:nucleoside-diphosphate-sugar epimerase/glycosyltransferase involved in cell wall biosynthesis